MDCRYFEGDYSFMCVLSIKVPIQKKSGNIFNDPRIYIYIYEFYNNQQRSLMWTAPIFINQKILNFSSIAMSFPSYICTLLETLHWKVKRVIIFQNNIKSLIMYHEMILIFPLRKPWLHHIYKIHNNKKYVFDNIRTILESHEHSTPFLSDLNGKCYFIKC